MNIEQRLAESIRSFGLDSLAGAVPLNIDLDLVLTVLAHTVCAAGDTGEAEDVTGGCRGGAAGADPGPVVIARVEARVTWLISSSVSGSRAPAARTAATWLDTVLDVTCCRAAISARGPAGCPSRPW